MLRARCSMPVRGGTEAGLPLGSGGQDARPWWRGVRTTLWRRLPEWLKWTLVWRGNAHFLVGAVALVWDGSGRILVARHTYRRHAPWALPGGWVRRDEDPADAVSREILEETGLQVEVLAPVAVRRERRNHLTVVYTARLAGGTFRPSEEVSEIRFILPGLWPDGLRADHQRLIEEFGGQR